MTTGALATILRVGLLVTALILGPAAAPALAHGIDVTAALEPKDGPVVASLELTDETGQVCLTFDREIGASAQASIEMRSGMPLVDLGSGFGSTERCQFLDVDSVDQVIADVGAHRLTVLDPETSETASGQLAKPTAPVAIGIEADSPESESTGPNLPLIFGIGAALGIAIAVIRKRLR